MFDYVPRNSPLRAQKGSSVYNILATRLYIHFFLIQKLEEASDEKYYEEICMCVCGKCYPKTHIMVDIFLWARIYITTSILILTQRVNPVHLLCKLLSVYGITT